MSTIIKKKKKEAKLIDSDCIKTKKPWQITENEAGKTKEASDHVRM